MHHAQQAGAAGHVDAVVVARAQVDGGEVPVLELRRQRRVAAQQGRGAVVVALGLKNLILGNGAKLTDGSIDGANPIGSGQRARTRAQGAGEKIVEAGVRGRIRGLKRATP